MKTKAGHYYGVMPSGRLVPAPPGDPDTIICRRIADFPGGKLPTGATAGVCTTCGAAIAYNAKRHYTAPFACMQCNGITPDPMPQG